MQNTVCKVDELYLPFIRTGANDPYHGVLRSFFETCRALPAPKVLEIGSREVSGIGRRYLIPNAGSYVGFDIHSGPGVDVVGDAHELSTCFPHASFDVVYSMSVFEHLAFPWKVVMETNKILKVGGICCVSTHPVWPPHELPWDFWRFPIGGIKLLFSAALGFEIVDAAEGLPAKLHSLMDDPPTRGVSAGEIPMGVALIARKIADYDSNRFKWDLPLSEVLRTMYPKIGKNVSI